MREHSTSAAVAEKLRCQKPRMRTIQHHKFQGRQRPVDLNEPSGFTSLGKARNLVRGKYGACVVFCFVLFFYHIVFAEKIKNK